MFQYKPLNHDKPEVAEPVGVGEDMPYANLDVDPSQLKGVEVGSVVTITIKAKVKSLRIDTDDSWGTGASISLGLIASDIDTGGDSTETEAAISSFIED